MTKPPPGGEADLWPRVTVRPLRDEERETFDRLLENRHYWASARLAGQTLRYVAEQDGQWVALLTFSAPDASASSSITAASWSCPNAPAIPIWPPAFWV